MIVTDYQGPLLSVFSCLTDRGRSADMCAPPAVQCSGPVRAALRWTSPPTAGQANAFAGLFHDDAAFEAMPASLTRCLNEEQPGNQLFHQGSACGGCFGEDRKVATRAMPFKPLGVVARQQSGFLVDDTPHSQLADGVLGVVIVGQGRRAEQNYYSVAISQLSPRASLRRSPAGHQPRPDHVLRPVAGPLVAGRHRA